MFWKQFVSLCNKNGTTPTAVVKDLGISGGSVTKWKNGSAPRDTTLQTIADYFGVSPEYFTEETKKDPNSEESELESRLLTLFRGVDNSDKEMLLDMIEAALKRKMSK